MLPVSSGRDRQRAGGTVDVRARVERAVQRGAQPKPKGDALTDFKGDAVRRHRIASCPEFDFLASHAEANPGKPAVILGDRMLDFASLDRAANRAASAIEGLGCKPGDRVAIMSFNSVEGFELANGLRRAGVVVVPGELPAARA